MREHQLPPRSTETASVVRVPRPPVRPADAVLALQRAGGNRATARVLSRFTDANKEKYDQAAGQLKNMRDLVEAVLNAHKATFEFKGPREPLVQPILAKIEVYAAALKQWEDTKDGAAETALIQDAMAKLKEAAALRPALYTALGGEDEAKGKAAVDKVIAARRKGAEDMAKQKEREAAFAADKAAEQKQRVELAEVFKPAEAGPAYARPPEAQLAKFHDHVRLSHTAFGELTLAQMRSPLCPLYVLTAAQLERVQNFCGRNALSGWTSQGVPETRQAALGGAERWLVPTHHPTLKFEFGGEIYADWVAPRHGHGFSIAQLIATWSFIVQQRGSPWLTETASGDKKIYEYKPDKRVVTKVITKHNDTVLITCYDTR